MKLIDKNALVKEIEKRIDTTGDSSAYLCGKLQAYREILKFINTLEVKDVDLEKEIDRVWDNTSDNFSEDGWKEFEDIAQYFFKLGLKSQKEE